MIGEKPDIELALAGSDVFTVSTPNYVIAADDTPTTIRFVGNNHEKWVEINVDQGTATLAPGMVVDDVFTKVVEAMAMWVTITECRKCRRKVNAP